MRIDQLFPAQTSLVGKTQNTQPAASSASFANSLSEALQKANDTIVQSENMSEKIATGEIKNIHDVTIAAQKAQIALQLTTQVRDKVVEAYQEIMRMQV
ncbi:flagellar hook-basal body complex protein FliE [Neobacillus rhizophilus]|uniref:Flagellar hook-basal body complex protein FliE n=1 Tax=Neobacillus rhizophilus TaxID=2833579 RepID=A0A942YTL5_9BACI|nr:flagellar hook-basal body complex protein FliE [Neobacillus rhizophilus]MBS4213043.1 flagellar hook-basal body complex protein FliE [Neobacillus rhizophilus]MBU8918259.1 flagellar hook-basal body complex protein FliE [Bacillus sp. FJAT-29953]